MQTTCAFLTCRLRFYAETRECRYVQTRPWCTRGFERDLAYGQEQDKLDKMPITLTEERNVKDERLLCADR